MSSEKIVEGKRLVWYEREADETFWFQHWEPKITPEYYASARKRGLERDELGRLILSIVPDGSSILEAGCGAGRYVAMLEIAGYDVTGIEYARPLVDLVRAAEPSLPVAYGDALHLDAAADSFDVYLSVGVVEHRREGPEPFFEEALRVLKPGGVAIVTVPAFGPTRRAKHRLGIFRKGVDPEASFYQYGFTGDELADALRAASFDVERVTHYGLYRLLTEEVPLYRWATSVRGGERLVRRPLDRLLGGKDGHMVAVVARKPG